MKTLYGTLITHEQLKNLNIEHMFANNELEIIKEDNGFFIGQYWEILNDKESTTEFKFNIESSILTILEEYGFDITEFEFYNLDIR